MNPGLKKKGGAGGGGGGQCSVLNCDAFVHMCATFASSLWSFVVPKSRAKGPGFPECHLLGSVGPLHSKRHCPPPPPLLRDTGQTDLDRTLH